MDTKTKLDLINDLNILEVAGELGIEIIANHCSKCIHPEAVKKNNAHLEFDIKKNHYKCPCMNETGDIVELVTKVNKISRDEAIDWLYEKFYNDSH